MSSKIKFFITFCSLFSIQLSLSQANNCMKLSLEGTLIIQYLQHYILPIVTENVQSLIMFLSGWANELILHAMANGLANPYFSFCKYIYENPLNVVRLATV